MQKTNILLYSAAFIISLVITALTVKKLIPFLKKRASQPIYELGPQWHMKKSGTPTMGGLGYLIAISCVLSIAVIYLFASDNTYFAVSLLLTAIYGALNSLIGVIDDISKIKKKENSGLSPLEKLILQTLCAALFLIARAFLLHDGTSVIFSFGSIDIGFLYFPLALFMLVGTVNAANLTDGIDGIASAVAFAIGCALALISAGGSDDVSFISFALIGSAIGFLIYNLHPAKIFMGDTGSLYLGSLIGACCISLGNPLIILLIGAVYFIEALSVILQVAFYKITKKRLFKMAPFHHHLEKCGFGENKIVICAMMLTFVASLAAFFIMV